MTRPVEAPAAETEGCTSCGYPSLYQGGCTNCGASAAPAGDGGLREAVKQLRMYCGLQMDEPDASEDEQVAYDDIAIQLAKILRDHPAAPAVPQPVDRERVAEVLHESDWRFNHGWKESGRCGEAHREQFYVQADALFDAGLLVGPCCAASAGDGGLREALEKLADDAVPLNGVEWVSAARLRDLLAAHSAAPAVPHGPYTEQETTK